MFNPLFNFPLQPIRFTSCMQELLDGFSQSGVVYLDLETFPTAAVSSAGPGSCIAGQLRLMPGMFGMPSQVQRYPPLLSHSLHALCFTKSCIESLRIWKPFCCYMFLAWPLPHRLLPEGS